MIAHYHVLCVSVTLDQMSSVQCWKAAAGVTRAASVYCPDTDGRYHWVLTTLSRQFQFSHRHCQLQITSSGHLQHLKIILHTSEKPRARASQHSTIPELTATLLTPACQLSCANIFVSEIILCWCGSHTGGVSVRIPPTRVSGDSVVETTCSGPSSSWLSDIRCEPASAGGSPQQSFSSYLSSLITLQQIHKHQYWPEHWAVFTWPTLNIFLLLSITSAPS